MTLQPAYGRDYKSKAAVLADFDAGKDFIVADLFSGYGFDKPINKPQVLEMGVRSVNIRYARNTKVAVIKVEEGGQIAQA
jgi:hypothetical protein